MTDVLINAQEWQSISAKDQAQITEILTKASLLKEGDSIVPDSKAPSVQDVAASNAKKLEGSNIPQVQPQGALCEFGCRSAQAVATAACAAFTGPAIAVCIAAATIAGEACIVACGD